MNVSQPNTLGTVFQLNTRNHMGEVGTNMALFYYKDPTLHIF